MRNRSLHTVAAALLFFGGIGLAAAQAPAESSTKPKGPAEQNPSAQHTQQPDANNPTGSQVAPGEPKSVHLPETGPAFVNGALATPNAPKDAQTVPAKFSAKNDFED